MLKTIKILFSALLYALAVKLFIVPLGLVTGGTTGIGLAAGYILKTDLSTFIFILNLVLLIIAYFILGKSFVANTIIASLSMPVILKGLDYSLTGYILTDDIFLATIFAGLLIGSSIAICMRAGASTGGVDIITLILKKYFRIPISVSLYVFDFFILLTQMFFQGIEKVLYGIVLLLIYTIVVEKLLVMGTSRMELKIISDKAQEVREAILTQLDRGITILHGEGGYTGENKQILLSIVSNRELAHFERFIHKIDPEAFIIISKVNEVSGKGFTLPKSYINRNEDK